MKKVIFIFAIFVLFTSYIFAQNVPLFEVVDNQSIGTVAKLTNRWGCMAADIDRNGWPDIFNTKWLGAIESEIFINIDGQFTDVYNNSPDLLEAEHNGYASRTPVFVDFDNDGDRDLMLGTDFNIFMFRNDDNVFTNISDDLGIVSGSPGFFSIYGYEQSAWIDIDLDGDNDAVVFQTNNKNLIVYRNDNDMFTDIAAEIGLADLMPLGEDGDRGYYTGRMQWVDYDNDGDPDLNAGYLLFRNNNGQFSEVSQEVGFTPYPKMRFADWFDYDVDGDMDYMFLTGVDNRDELWKNEGGTFVDATQEVSLDLYAKPFQAGMNTGDFDNDGDQDVFIQINDHLGDDIESLLLNDLDQSGTRSFIDVGFYAGLTKTGDRKGAAVLDYDMDGRLDIFVSSLDYGGIMYHNLGVDPANNWIGFDLWGTESSRDPLGTLVTLYAEGKKQIRYTKAAASWKTQDNPFIHFGIGQATSIDSVVIKWPLGIVQVLTNLEINRYYIIEESKATNVEQNNSDPVHTPNRITLEQNYPNPFNPETNIIYFIHDNSHVRLDIYDMNGNLVNTLIDIYQQKGDYSVSWDAKNFSDNSLSSGVYVYRLSSGNSVISKKMLFIK